MQAIKKLEAIEMREKIFASSNYRCAVCGCPVRKYGTAQLGHRIPSTRAWLAKYGPAIIHHPRNLAPVCGLRCNSAILIGNNPRAREELAAEITALLAAVDEMI